MVNVTTVYGNTMVVVPNGIVRNIESEIRERRYGVMRDINKAPR